MTPIFKLLMILLYYEEEFNMYVLGVNADSHDMSAVLVRDGTVLCAAEEERFTRKKHQDTEGWSKWPDSAIGFCLEWEGIKPRDLDCVAFSWDTTPSFKNFKNAFRHIRSHPEKARLIHKYAFNGFKRISKKNAAKSRQVKHHLSHAASAYRVSGFKKANILVLDNGGEDSATSLYIGRNREIEPFGDFSQGNSLGRTYAFITGLLGLGTQFDAGKTMALASYAEPSDKFSRIIRVKKHSYKVDWNEMKKLQAYKRTGKILPEHKQIAATIQRKLEECALELLDSIHENTGYKNLCLAGGVALNCQMNSELLQSGKVNKIFIQPAAGDSGSALGAALEASNELGCAGKSRKMEHASLGTEYSNEEIERTLRAGALECERVSDIDKAAAELVSRGKVGGWFSGRMEFGPRALGNRSIIADPRGSEMQGKINSRIKHRESFRPFAPSALEEKAEAWFENTVESRFMILNFLVKEEKKQIVPAITHVDGTARIQTVSKSHNKPFHGLVREFGRITGVPLVLNTSFNSKTEPIVESPQNAIETFKRTGLDFLAVGDFLLER